MGAFDFESCGCCQGGEENPVGNVKDECLIAFKVYDFFRIQECLKQDVLGFSRAAEDTIIDGHKIEEGEVIIPPRDAASVTIENLEIEKVNVLGKKKNTLRNGFFDVDLQFIFVYKLIFAETGGCCICSVLATNTFSTKVSLFGSIDTDVNLSTDLFGGRRCGGSVTLEANPFIWVESKAMPLAAELVYPCGCGCEANTDAIAVRVTIGLFAIIKLFRIVNLLVESKGFCIPEEIGDISATDPCDFFENLDFPMDSFAPPQRPEFMAGISSNLPNRPQREREDKKDKKDKCGCDCCERCCENCCEHCCDCDCGCC